MLAQPIFLFDGQAQTRMWCHGSGMDLLVLPGLHLGAQARAHQLASLLTVPDGSGPGIAVVDLMSVVEPQSSLETMTRRIACAARQRGRPRALLAFDLARPLLAPLLDALRSTTGHAPLAAWAMAHDTPPTHDNALEQLTPVADGIHLLSMWNRLRELSLIDSATLRARKQGPGYATTDELDSSLLEFAERPAHYQALWWRLQPLQKDEAVTPGAQVLASVDDLKSRLAELPPLPPLPQALSATVTDDTERLVHWRCYVLTRSGRFHVRRYGHQGPSVILLQSAPGSAAPLDVIGRHLSQQFQVHCPDLLGNGESSKPERVPTITTLAGEVIDYAQAQGLDTFHLWGTHTGAKIALSVAAQAPQRVNRIVLDGLSLMSADMCSDVLQHYLPKFISDIWGTHLYRAWQMRRDMFLFWPWYRQTFETTRKMKLPDTSVLHDWTMGMLQSGRTYDQSYRAAFECDARPLLAGLTHPTLLTVGPDDMFASHLDTARDLMPICMQIQSTPATAWYPGQAPEAVAQTLQTYTNFLANTSQADHV